MKLFSNTEKVIYIAGVVLAILVYVITVQQNPIFEIAALRLARSFGLISFGLLFLALFASPLYKAFPEVPGKLWFTKAAKPFGVSAFFFALLHGHYAFFKVLRGFEGLSYLSTRYLLAVVVSTLTLGLLAILTAISFEYISNKLGESWKWLRKLVYVVAFLAPLHALLIGSHFTSGDSLIGQVFIFLWLLLLLLQEIRLHQYLCKRYPQVHPKITGGILVVVFSVIFYVILLTDTFISHHNV